MSSKLHKFRLGSGALTITASANGSTTMRVEVTSLAVQEPNPGRSHSNRAPFSGTLMTVDEPSQHPPGGAQGHRILLPAVVAEAALDSLLMMAVDVTDDLAGHSTKKIGIITGANVVGNEVRVEGFLYEKDFPEEVAAIRAKSREGKMGMSFEAGVGIEDPTQEIWVASEIEYTGAAILLKDTAAYGHKTSLVANAEEKKMDQELKEMLAALIKLQAAEVEARIEANKAAQVKAEADAAAATQAAAVEAAVSQVKAEFETTVADLAAKLADAEAKIAAGTTDEDAEEGDEVALQAGKDTDDRRVTLPPSITRQFTTEVKASLDSGEKITKAQLKTMLAGKPVAQRMAIKAQLSSKGLIEG